MFKRTALLVFAGCLASSLALASDCPEFVDPDRGGMEGYAERVLRQAWDAGQHVMLGGPLRCMPISHGLTPPPTRYHVIRSLCTFNVAQDWTPGPRDAGSPRRRSVDDELKYIWSVNWADGSPEPWAFMQNITTSRAHPLEVYIFGRRDTSTPRVISHGGFRFPIHATRGDCAVTLSDTPRIRWIARSLGFRVPDGPAR